MTTIKLHTHPFSGRPPEVFEVDSLAQWVVDRYERGPRVTKQIFEGEPCGRTDISGDYKAVMRGDAPVYTVLESPGDPYSIIANLAISMVLSAAVNFLFAKDPKPLDNRSQESPNNQLSDRQNRVRVLERVPDIFGTTRAIPDLMMPTYQKYIDHKKVEYGYYCIGRGYYDIADVREGDTLLSDISGASAAIYAPFTSPNSGTPQATIGDSIIDSILSVRRSGAVDGIVLKPTNQLQITAGMQYQFYGPGSGAGSVPASTLDLLWQFDGYRKPNFAAVAEVGQSLTISMANVETERDHTTTGGHTITAAAATKTYTSTITGFFRGIVVGSTVEVFAGFADGTNTGTKTVVSATGETLTVAEALADEVGGGAVFTMQVNYSGVRTIAAVESGYVTLSGSPQFSPLDYPLTPVGTGGIVPVVVAADVTVDNGLVDWTDWFTLSDTDLSEVWTNVVARSGMYKDDGAKHGTTVAYELQLELLTDLLVPTGTTATVSGSITGATSNERAETLERVTGWSGPVRSRMRRTTPFDYDFSGGVIDEIHWMDLYSVSPVSNSHFGNKTTIHTVTRTTAGSTAITRRELNCLAARKLPTYNGSVFSGAFNADGLHTTGTISATSKIVDIIAAVTIDPKIGKRAITELDMAQLWSVQQALDAWNAQCGQFNYTFDSDSISFEETVHAIANAAFCVPYRQNGKIRLALDRPQASSVALFTHRNKRPRAETITRTFANDSEYDGIELVYTDPESEQQETIRLPLDGSYTKLKKVEITGIRSYEQAWFRANRDYRRLIGQRMTLEMECTTDARALVPNARISNVDNTRFKSYDGEVIAQDGLTLTLSREVEFMPSEPHSIILQQRDGTPESIACTAGAAANQVVLAGLPSETIVTAETADDGIRTSFSFAADSARNAQLWLVQEISPTDGQYVRVRAVNYSADYYAADSEAVPAKEGVIN